MKPAKVTKQSTYFLKKYGDATPNVMIECTDLEAWGKSWMDMYGNPAALMYAMRSGLEGLPITGTVYYGKVGVLGELFHESELKFEEPKETL
jgi:hypothetical protein